jgi:hypothetical protein
MLEKELIVMKIGYVKNVKLIILLLFQVIIVQFVMLIIVKNVVKEEE